MLKITQKSILGATCVCTFTLLSSISLTVQAAAISGQGTWESTLQGRDLDGNAATFEAYYDTTLDITWLANGNINGLGKWQNQKDWAASLTLGGFNDWRLPTNTPLNGSTYNTSFSNNGTTDRGAATTTTDGTDGGYRDGAGNPVSEMGHMFYVTLGNLGVCIPNGSGLATVCNGQSGFGLSNTADFINVQSSNYWSGSALDSSDAWVFNTKVGLQGHDVKSLNLLAWAVRSGDVSTGSVPIPAAVWLFGSGLLGLVGVARRKSINLIH